MGEKGFSQACENNKLPILQCLQGAFTNTRQVLEIGSGTGQHAVFFAANLPHLTWQTSDLPVNHPSILAWQVEQPVSNLRAPVPFTIGLDDWPRTKPAFDGVFTANTTHIMQPQQVRLMMQLVSRQLPAGGVFCQYGPFNENGDYTSESNREFDLYLQAQGYGGIQDIAQLQNWAGCLLLQKQAKLPANNQLLVWQQP